MSETPETRDETLAERLERGPIEPRVVLEILERLLTVLEPVHSGGAVHRHITPEVIYLTADGQATLTGFERMGTSGGPATVAANATLDDPQYKAPEQFLGDPVDARTDVFALGVIAYEMLTGKNPFLAAAGESSSSAAYRIVYSRYPEIARGTIPGLEERARLVLMTAMAKDAKTRFSDAGSFLEALTAAPLSANGAAPLAVPVATTDAGGRWRGWTEALFLRLFEIQRSPAPYVIAALLVVAGLAVAIFVVSARAQNSGASETSMVASSVTTTTAAQVVPVTDSTTVTTEAASTTTLPPTTATESTTTTTVKLPATVTLSGLTATYNRSPAKVVAKTAPEGLKVVITYTQADKAVEAPTNAGTYAVTAMVDDPQYQGSATGTLTIAKANASINVSGWRGTYDGDAHRASGTARGAGGENLSSLLSISGSFTSVPGGTAQWTFSGNANYNSANGSAAITISKANATINISGYNHAYDGKAHGATLVSAKGVSGENLSALVSMGGQTYTNVPGGPARWNFLGNQNYYATSGSVSITITKANASIHVSGWSGEYDGYSHGASGSASGVLGESLSGLLNLGASFSSVGTHTATWTFAGSANYNSDSGSVSVVITEPPTTTTVPPG